MKRAIPPFVALLMLASQLCAKTNYIPRLADLQFYYVGETVLTSGQSTQAQVTVFDSYRNSFYYQTPIYRVDGTALQPGENYTCLVSLTVRGNDGRIYDIVRQAGEVFLLE